MKSKKTIVALTKGQASAVKACWVHFLMHHRLPNHNQLANILGCHERTASYHLTAMKEKGLLMKNENGTYRFSRKHFHIFLKPKFEIVFEDERGKRKK